MKISHLGLIDKESLNEAIQQRNFVGDTKRDDSEKNEQISSSKSNEEIHNRNFRNVTSMSNQEIHNLLQEEVDRIKANKTKSKVPEEKNNIVMETNYKNTEYVKTNEKKNQKYPEPYSKEISYEGSL